MSQQGSTTLQRNHIFLEGMARRYMIGSVAGIFSVYIGAMIDTVLVGYYLGETGLSAMSLVGPVYLLYYTVGAVIGIGGSIAGSHAIGRGELRLYRQIFTLSALLMLTAAVVVTAAGIWFLDPLATFLGGTGIEREWAKEYLRYYIPGGGFTLLSYLPLYFLKADGRPGSSMGLFFVFSTLNAGLTWLFMSPVVGMGIGGASLATSIAMGITSMGGLVLLLHGGETRLSGGFSPSLLRKICMAGAPAGLSNLLESLRIYLINLLLLGMGAGVLLPVYTVVRNVMDLLGAVMLGIASTLQPLVGVFFAERDDGGVRSVFRYLLGIGLGTTALLSIGVVLFPATIGGAFGISDPAVLASLTYALPLACAGSIFGYGNLHLSSYYNTIRREWISNLILSLRLFGYLGLFAWLLSRSMGAAGVWLSFTLTEIATLLTVWAVVRRICHKNPELDRLFLHRRRERRAELFFSVENTVDAVIFSSQKINDFCEENEIAPNKAMKISLALEEILTVILQKCIGSEKTAFVELRVAKLDDEVMVRFRNAGKIFDPVQYYEAHENDPDYADELLGLRMVIKSAKHIDFRKTLGVNNLMILF